MRDSRFKLLSGNEAVTEGALAAGMRLFSGYPITPSTEIAESSARRLPQVGGKYLQMEDEIGGISAVIGASAAGVKAMTATSGPGFSLMQENLGYAVMAELPLVIVDVQRMGPSTGLPTSPSQGDYMQTRWGTHGDHGIIVVSPASVQECYDEIIRAFNLAEEFRTPVIFLMDETIGHLREGVELRLQEDLSITERKYEPFGCGSRYNITGLFHNSKGFPTNDKKEAEKLQRKLLDKIEKNRDKIEKYQEINSTECETLIICFGGVTRTALELIEENGSSKYGLFRPVTVWPFPERGLNDVINKNKNLKNIVVAELNDGQMLLEVQRIVEGRVPVSHVGKINGTIIYPSDISAL